MAKISEVFNFGNESEITNETLLKHLQEMYRQLAIAVNSKPDIVQRNIDGIGTETFLSNGSLNLNNATNNVQMLTNHPTQSTVTWTNLNSVMSGVTVHAWAYTTATSGGVTIPTTILSSAGIDRVVCSGADQPATFYFITPFSNLNFSMLNRDNNTNITSRTFNSCTISNTNTGRVDGSFIFLGN